MVEVSHCGHWSHQVCQRGSALKARSAFMELKKDHVLLQGNRKLFTMFRLIPRFPVLRVH